MSRRALDDPAATAPAWVRTYDPADWRDPADELTEEFADLAALFGPHVAREVRTRGRWIEVRRVLRGGFHTRRQIRRLV